MKTYSDDQLGQEIEKLKLTIQKWAEKNDLWHDAGFKPARLDIEPNLEDPLVLRFWSEGPLNRVITEDIDGLGYELSNMLMERGYFYENDDGTTFSIYVEKSDLKPSFYSYQHWQWVCSLIEPDYGDVYEEIYARFAKSPEDLFKLTPRQFEILLSKILQNQGFEAVLGPGTGDGGKDIHFLQKGPLGDTLTYVQAKRYAPHRKIGLEAVAALYGVMMADNAQKGLFITTSSFQPAAKRFSTRISNTIELKTSDDVAAWCKSAASGIIKDKSSLVSDGHVLKIISETAGNRDSRVLHAYSGYSMELNRFALVLKETRHAAILMSLPAIKIPRESTGQIGYEIPRLDYSVVSMKNQDTVRRAKRKAENGAVSYWDGYNLYHPWDGVQKSYNTLD